MTYERVKSLKPLSLCSDRVKAIVYIARRLLCIYNIRKLHASCFIQVKQRSDALETTQKRYNPLLETLSGNKLL